MFPNGVMIVLLGVLGLIGLLLPFFAIGYFVRKRQWRRLGITVLAVVLSLVLLWFLESFLVSRFSPPDLSFTQPSWISTPGTEVADIGTFDCLISSDISNPIARYGFMVSLHRLLLRSHAVPEPSLAPIRMDFHPRVHGDIDVEQPRPPHRRVPRHRRRLRNGRGGAPTRSARQTDDPAVAGSWRGLQGGAPRSPSCAAPVSTLAAPSRGSATTTTGQGLFVKALSPDGPRRGRPCSASAHVPPQRGRR